jgi:hypothetical protein
MFLSKTLLPFLLVLAPQTADGWLGVYLRDTDHPEIAEVIPGSPAAEAGLRAGDRFVAVGAIETETREAFVRAIRGASPGTELQLRLRRGDRAMTRTVRLAARPRDADVAQEAPARQAEERPPRPGQEPAPGRRAFLGLSLRQAEDGVVVSEVVEDGPSAKAGVRAGERVVRLGEIDVRVLRDLERALARMAPGDRIALTLLGDRGTRSVLVELGTAPGSPPPEPGQADPRPPDRPPGEPQAGQERGPKVVDDVAAARRLAEARGLPILLVFGASWNSASRAQRKAMADPTVAELLEDAVPLWLDTDEHGAEAERMEVQELPHLRILKGGKTVWRHEGYLPPAELARALKQHVGQAGAAEPAAAPEIRAALERVAARLDRVEERLRRLDSAARELDGLDQLREELQAIRKLLRSLGK